MHRNTQISLGDLVRAIRKLRVTDFETQKVIALMLGMELMSPVTIPPANAGTQTGTLGLTPTDETIHDLGSESQPDATLGDSVPIRLEHTPSENDEWIKEVEPLPLPPDDITYVAPDLEPLLLPQWTRAIITASLVTNTKDGLPDIEKITDMLARGEAVRQLPTRSSRTLRRGVQLLVDKSLAMTPFARDQAWLQKEIRQVVGSDHVEVKRFVGSPLRGAGKGSKPWPDYSPPLPGTPVMLLTDLGICQPMLSDDWADVQEWVRFSDEVRHAHCPLIAFVPYRSRWPNELKGRMTIIHWDRSTTAPVIRSIVGDGLEVATS